MLVPSEPATLLLPPAEAVREELRLLAGTSPMRELSLWILDHAKEPICLASVRGKPSAGVRKAAAAALRGRPTAPSPRRTLVAAAIARDGENAGVLAARVPPGGSADALAAFDQAAPVLAWILDRRTLLESNRRQGAVLTAAERRLTRFGIDLHDGPAQEIAALLSDLRLFEGQLSEELEESPHAKILSGRLSDLEQRAADLESHIRELARTAGAASAIEGALEPLLRAEIRSFAQTTGVSASLDVKGPVDESTVSQRITLLRGVQEALRNAREHSRARSVSVVVEAPPGGLEARVEDDGVGFDVKRTLRRAQRTGSLGLGGIQERARLLGGGCELDSKPGGPTVVTIKLPRWKPGEMPPAD